MSDNITYEEIEVHLRRIVYQYKWMYRLYIYEDGYDKKDLQIELLKLRDQYNRTRLLVFDNSISVMFLN